MDVQTMLSEFIASESAKPFAWGKTDCGATADRWMCGWLGYSPLAAYGRVHKDERDAKEWLADPGGIAVAVNRVMRFCSIRKTKTPQAGDVGLVIVKQRMCIAVNAGPVWFSRDEAGLIGAPLATVWKAWKVV